MGDKVKGDVTFPEDYGNDDLNGQTKLHLSIQ